MAPACYTLTIPRHTTLADAFGCMKTFSPCSVHLTLSNQDLPKSFHSALFGHLLNTHKLCSGQICHSTVHPWLASLAGSMCRLQHHQATLFHCLLLFPQLPMDTAGPTQPIHPLLLCWILTTHQKPSNRVLIIHSFSLCCLPVQLQMLTGSRHLCHYVLLQRHPSTQLDLLTSSLPSQLPLLHQLRAQI